jgi:hypothetical protein
MASSTATCYTLDPLRDSRWPEFLKRHPRASIFHTPEWLEALRRTYGYEPVALTTSKPDEELHNGVAFCRIKSILTGRRMVSIPFADDCEPLVDSTDDWTRILSFLRKCAESENYRFIEIRPRTSECAPETGFGKGKTFYFHSLDLRPDARQIFQGFHKQSIQRKIRRAEREGVAYEEGRTSELLEQFYRLLVLTRRRHKLPPQPLEWFRNLMNCMGERAKVRVCRNSGEPIAAVITLYCKNSMVYKYGCSDARFHNLGGMPYLFWKVIQDAKQTGATELDLGRSDRDNEGLVKFKEHLGGKRSLMTYWTYPAGDGHGFFASWAGQLPARLFRWAPDWVLVTTGRVFYKHMG